MGGAPPKVNLVAAGGSVAGDGPHRLDYIPRACGKSCPPYQNEVGKVLSPPAQGHPAGPYHERLACLFHYNRRVYTGAGVANWVQIR